jgi:hypothetical protein
MMMKEDRFIDIMKTIKPDPDMDQRMIDHLINYEDSTSDQSIINMIKAICNKKIFFRNISISVSTFLLFIMLGTTTAFAGYLIKSYLVNDYYVIKEPDAGLLAERNITSYGEGHVNKTVYVDGKIIEKPEDVNKEDVKYGDEVFGLLGLPNLIPTYLYNNYLVEEGGYKFIEGKTNDGSEYKKIAGGFFSVNTSKYVYIDFSPSNGTMKDTDLILADNNLSKEDIKSSSYTTKGGLTCNLTEDEKNDMITAIILFDSEALGNAYYLLSFTHIDKEEVKTILDSIPYLNVSD